MKRMIFSVLIPLFLFLPTFVLADTIVSGQISSDTTWSPSGGVYVIDSGFSIASGITLTIEPGTIIKAKSTWYGGPSIYGHLVARGTSELPIYFTSIYDDSVGGDTDGDGLSVGAPAQWQGLYFKEGSSGYFENVIVRYSGYGGYGFGNYVGIENDGGAVEIKNSEIIHNYVITNDGGGGTMTVGSGVNNISGSLIINNSNIEDNHTGIRVSGGSVVISGNTIKNNIDHTGRRNAGYGLYSYDQDSITLNHNDFSGNNRMASVDVSKGFIHFGNTSSDLSRKGLQIGGILTENFSLVETNLPYIIQGLIIPEGTTLSVNPGVIIKMDDYYSTGAINVRGGNLIMKGTPEDKIYITSLKDDSVGGDTNGDGDASAPGAKNWNAMYFETGSIVDFDNVVLRYGGYNYGGEYLLGVTAVIYDRGAELSVANSLFEHNNGAAIFKDVGVASIVKTEFKDNAHAIHSRGGTITVTQSIFQGDNSYGVYNQSGVDLGWWYPTKPMEVIDARNNWWGSADGPKDISTSTPTGSGSYVSENVLYEPWLASDPRNEGSGLRPVLIIPGIVGSELYNGDDHIWLNLDRMLVEINDHFLSENLKLNDLGESLNDITPKNILYKTINLDMFQGLIEYLYNENYIINNNLFVYPYDWRIDLDITKNLLHQKIEQIKNETGSDKVDIVAHSMGGLLTKVYIDEFGEGGIGKLIFVGTPHLGAPKAGKVLLEGDRFGIPWLENDRIKEIAHNSPALHQLLPTQKYFNEYSGYIRKYKMFGQNPILNYSETKQFFVNDKNKNSFMFELTQNLENKKLYELNFSGIDVYNIAGCKTATQDAYGLSIFGKIGQTRYSSGDGTVPLVSADYIDVDNDKKFYIKEGNHARLPSANGVRELISNILKNEEINYHLDVSKNKDFCDFKGKSLSWHSPVDIHIYDSFGNHTGPIEGGIEYGIREIDYEIIGHNKFIFIPTGNGKEYLVEAKGTDIGSFDLKVSDMLNGDYMTTKIFNDIHVNVNTKISFIISEEEKNNFIILSENGEYYEVEYGAEIFGNEIEDLVPPTTDVKISVIINKKLKKSGLHFVLNPKDDQSGVFETYYSVDNGNNFFSYKESVQITKDTRSILYYSIDKAGNNEDIKKMDLKSYVISNCRKEEKCVSMKFHSKELNNIKDIKKINLIKNKFTKFKK